MNEKILNGDFDDDHAGSDPTDTDPVNAYPVNAYPVNAYPVNNAMNLLHGAGPQASPTPQSQTAPGVPPSQLSASQQQTGDEQRAADRKTENARIEKTQIAKAQNEKAQNEKAQNEKAQNEKAQNAKSQITDDIVPDVLTPAVPTEGLESYLSLLTATLESTADGIVVLDLSGNIIAYNTKFARIWQFPIEMLQRRDPDEMRQYSAHQLKDVEVFPALVSKHLAAPEVETFDEIQLKDGRTFERYGFPQRVHHKCVGVVVNFRDVTQRKQAERAQAHLAAIVDSSHDAVLSKTLDGIVTSWNQAAERLFGYTAFEMIGQPILKLFPQDRVHEEAQILAQLSRGENVDHFETVRLRKDGQPIEVSITLSPIRDMHGHIIGISKIARDITKRKQAESEREAILTREQQAREEAEAASRTKDEFLATLSHELRTPLNAILGWSQLISDGCLSEGEKYQGIETIQRNAQLQARLIEDILDVSRIITGKMRLDVRPVNLSPILQSALDSVLPAAQAKQIKLKSVRGAHSGLVSVDPNRMQQVVWNLLTNAIKFTPPGGEVQVGLENLNSLIQITVQDSGIGIDPNVLPHIFDRFRQADQSSTRRFGGLGLGLSIVRHIVEAHGGWVEVHSNGLEPGSLFTVTLPAVLPLSVSTVRPTLRPEAIAQSGQDMEVTGDAPTAYSKQDRESQTMVTGIAELAALHVLVVDDDNDACSLVQTVLQSGGAHVTIASSAAQALELLQSCQPDVLISDLGMPDEDGYSLIQQVRTLAPEQGGLIPAMALTAYAGAEDRLKVLRSGFQVYLPKPIQTVELIALVASLGRNK